MSKFIPEHITQSYINRVLGIGGRPLKIMHKITESGDLMLMRYALNESNADSFAVISELLVPQYLKAIYLFENSMNDSTISYILEGIAQANRQGLTGIYLMTNEFGSQTFEVLGDKLFRSNVVKTLKKLTFKNTTRGAKINFRALCSSFMLNSANLSQLTKLSLSNVGLGSLYMDDFAEAVKFCGGLQSLDISANKIDSKGLLVFLKGIHKRN